MCRPFSTRGPTSRAISRSSCGVKGHVIRPSHAILRPAQHPVAPSIPGSTSQTENGTEVHRAEGKFIGKQYDDLIYIHDQKAAKQLDIIFDDYLRPQILFFISLFKMVRGNEIGWLGHTCSSIHVASADATARNHKSTPMTRHRYCN